VTPRIEERNLPRVDDRRAMAVAENHEIGRLGPSEQGEFRLAVLVAVDENDPDTVSYETFRYRPRGCARSNR
jgi:hypothetical protein